MAATQYQIFCRYLNENINRALTNRTSIEWVDAKEYEAIKSTYTTNKSEYETMKTGVKAGTLKEKTLTLAQSNIYVPCKRYEYIQKQVSEGKAVIEYVYIRPADAFTGDTNGTKRKAAALLDQEKYQIIIDQNQAGNPKYDMVFMYDGIEAITGEGTLNPPPNNTTSKPYLHYERMKRIKLDPWFLYSSHGSLRSAMTRANQLVNIMGKDAVKIGKVVSLDQYIEIV